MYEQFGALPDHEKKTVTFKLFLPDASKDPKQYEAGGLPRITRISVMGSFQNPETKEWDDSSAIELLPTDYTDPRDNIVKGVVYTAQVEKLPDGFYEYKYKVEFENGETRMVCDPCGRCGGAKHQNSGFVVGDKAAEVKRLARRLPYQDLRIYELMIDDFTANIRKKNEAPLQTIVRKLDYLQSLGINAIEFMPWNPCSYSDAADSSFTWGYNPVQYFGLSYHYSHNPAAETEKLVYLKQLVNECHERGIHVIMDGVFNHVDAAPPDFGFPYYWLYQDPAESPYVGEFAEHEYFRDMNYSNRCTLEYVRDACIYWIEEFGIDGIRLDNTLGYYKQDDLKHGLPKLLEEIDAYVKDCHETNFAIILEHSWDYDAIDVTNKVDATSCWYDPFRTLSEQYLHEEDETAPPIQTTMMRMLETARGFEPGRIPTTYLENHDHSRIITCAGGRNSWHRTQPYVIALMTCFGAPLIYNGQEFGADYEIPEDGDGRVVARPLEWSQAKSAPGPALLDLYQKMMQIREEHPGLRSPHFAPSNWDEAQIQFNKQGLGIDLERGLVVYRRWSEDEKKREHFFVALNFSDKPQQVDFEIPHSGVWRDLMGGPEVQPEHGRIQTEIGSNWGAIFYREG
jgi:pullulanase